MSSALSNVLDVVSNIISMAVVIAIMIVLFRRFGSKRRRGMAGGERSNGSADNEPDRLVRLWKLLTQNGKIGLAVAAAALLAFAQFFTTRLGLSNFIPWLPVAIMAAIGIQVILYLGAWLVAERSADRAFLRRKRFELEAGVGEPEEFSRAEAAVKSAGSWWVWTMFATGLWVSVFFSFDALFDHVYLPDQQLLNNMKVARSTIGSMFGSMERKITEDRNDELKNLTAGKDWQTWQTNLAKILDTADGSKDLLQAAWTTENNRLQLELADARQRLQKQQEQVARTKAELDAIGRAPAQGQAGAAAAAAADTKQFEDRRDELQRDVSGLERDRDDLTAKLSEEKKAGGLDGQGKRRPAGEGTVWRELKVKLDAVDANLSARRASLEEVKRRLNATKQDVASAAAKREIKASELQRAESEIGDLTLKMKDAESRARAFAGEGEKAASALTGVSDQVLAVRRALVNFTGTGSTEAYNAMLGGCNTLLEMLQRQEKTKERIGTASCDAMALAPRAAKLVAFETATTKYKEQCQVDDAFNALTAVKGMVDRARVCAGLSALPFNRISTERGEIDRVEQENSPSTSHFERAIATLSRGDKLAWLALAIAFSIDFLVLVAAMLGARAADHIAPQSVLDEMALAPYIDLRIHDDDPTHIRNQKIVLSLIEANAEPNAEDAEAKSQPVVDLNDVPHDLRNVIQSLLTMYVSMKMAFLDAHQPGVYRLTVALVSKMVREVGSYEKRRPDARPSNGGSGNGPTAPGGIGSTSNDNDSDPLEPKRFADRKRQLDAEGGTRPKFRGKGF